MKDKLIEEIIEWAKNNQPDQLVAAFDADGTLWDTDIGENYFKWQIEHLSKDLKLPENPWEYYRKWKESGDPRPAYLWLAQIHQGFTLEQVRLWSKQALKERFPMGVPSFHFQHRLINELHQLGVSVYVVTASVKWSVEPAAELFCIKHENVIGVATKVVDGRVTAIQEGEITYRPGKLKAIQSILGGKKLFLASGNSFGDLELLEGASNFRLCINAAKPEDELHPAEQKLQAEAKKRGWVCLGRVEVG